MPAPKRDTAHKADLVAIIRKYMFMYGLTIKRMAPMIAMSEKTLRLRMKNPGSFTLDEINLISRVIKIPARDLSPILTWGYVS